MPYGLPPFIQDAAVTALEEDAETASDVRTHLARRRDFLTKEFASLTGAKLYSKGGGMFAVLDARPLHVSYTQFAWNLLDKYQISLLPYDSFGNSGRGLLRFSLCEPDEVAAIAAQRICEFMRNEFDQ